MVVLQRTGDDFRGRGRGTVDQHDNRRTAHEVAGRRCSIDAVVGAVAPARCNHDPAIDELAGDLDRGVEETAGIVAQIEDQAVQPAVRALLQSDDGGSELDRRGFGERRHARVTDIVGLEIRLDGDDTNNRARQGEIEGRALAACDR